MSAAEAPVSFEQLQQEILPQYLKERRKLFEPTISRPKASMITIGKP